jgi:ABC-2 type transport system permease protein
MFLILGGVLLLAFPFAAKLFAVIDIDTVWQLILMLLALIPAVVLASAIVMFSFTIASGQIGGIILLFIETIIMSYTSGCLMPSYYLPDAIKELGKFMPTYFMQKQATNALSGFVSAKNTIIILVYAAAFTLVSSIIVELRSRRAEG